jgi:hypothetical protein
MMSSILVAHVVVSIVAIVAGLPVAAGLLTGRLSRWTAAFLWTTVATSASGYLLPATELLPSHIVGAISLVALVIAIVGLYRKRLAGWWRPAFVISSTLALYLNLFVGVVQAFQKIPVLTALAPTQSEPPFAIAQGALFLLFFVVVVLAVRRSPRVGAPPNVFA